MDLSNCEKCGQLIIKSNSIYCKKCLDAQKDLINEIKEYISHHPNSNILDLQRETGIPFKDLINLIKEKRIDIREN